MPSLQSSDLISLLCWLAIIILSSYLLSESASRLSYWLGKRFVGSIVLSIATTFPEIAIVSSAVNEGYLDAALGASIGSNLLMITLGLSLVALFATTRLLSRAQVKRFSTLEFRVDMYFLAGTALFSLILLVHGIALVSGLAFLAIFAYYVYRSYSEIGAELSKEEDKGVKPRLSSTITFLIAGTAGVIIGSRFFVRDLANVSVGLGVSLAVLSLVISPIAGEMPEKISLILLARKGQGGLRIAVANIFGSKILNNTLLLGIFALLSVGRRGLSVSLASTNIEAYQLVLVAVVTVLALLLVSKSIDARKAVVLVVVYVVSIILQFAVL